MIKLIKIYQLIYAFIYPIKSFKLIFIFINTK